MCAYQRLSSETKKFNIFRLNTIKKPVKLRSGRNWVMMMHRKGMRERKDDHSDRLKLDLIREKE